MSYWQETRHPGPSLLFLAPLLIAYEVGVVSLGGAKALRDLFHGVSLPRFRGLVDYAAILAFWAAVS